MCTPLLAAVAVDRDPYDACKALLRAGADPNEESPLLHKIPPHITATFPLHEALLRGHVRVVHLLLEHGADPFRENEHTRQRAVHWARRCAMYQTPSTLATLVLFENMERARAIHRGSWDDLEKELMAAVWHPVRLARMGYFYEDCDDREIICA